MQVHPRAVGVVTVHEPAAERAVLGECGQHEGAQQKGASILRGNLAPLPRKGALLRACLSLAHGPFDEEEERPALAKGVGGQAVHGGGVELQTEAAVTKGGGRREVVRTHAHVRLDVRHVPRS
ncbi:hypothetical protein EBZ80_21055, partial [bacterium]|nr:hypothetical protein [bacterium]